ncbi:hypothetical protein D9611_005299 [Ephemerocybe angulata]|uniref:Uncharacterized protein n=1 Tax=Ephemerocybe angulata TaxID=980116 RepID=A0A8H5C244_9AGAR|nr:hypothetical protein D9611_005299 [Tulosesus angulatus]
MPEQDSVEYKKGTRVYFVRTVTGMNGESAAEGECGEVLSGMKSVNTGMYSYVVKLEKNGLRLNPVYEDDIVDVPEDYTGGST